MTLPSSGTLVLGSAGGGNSINSEFGYGNDLASYLGVYYGKGGVEYRFPVSGNSIDMNGFYGTYRISGGSTSITSSQNFLIPVYNTITITTYGDQGGQAGQYGINGCTGNTPTASHDGYVSGVTTSFGGYVTSGWGSGGSGNQALGSYGPVYTSSFTNPVQGGSGPPSGQTIYAQVGPGGAGGGGGPNAIKINGYCYPAGNGATGVQGGAGRIDVSWS